MSTTHPTPPPTYQFMYQFVIEVRTPQARIRLTTRHTNALAALDEIAAKYPNATHINIKHRQAR